MRRFIYGTLLTIPFMLGIFYLTNNGLALALSFFQGISLSYLWDIGVSSNIEKYRKDEEGVK